MGPYFFGFSRARSGLKRSAATRLRDESRAAEGGRPKAFVAKRKSLQGRASSELRTARPEGPKGRRGSPKRKKT
ncbi:hypothetical protein SGRA_2952 [Saprospira grandis str. Lewin]|uniref:Uncharacterized protein n=1 Tax=Saprospira grandis (strain Lewin) TaxID=984262 RepID=H6LAT7_SAPGL|nr:hypothetical protein SGRA_2952 [Saprospira grandis str. Lewin]